MLSSALPHKATRGMALVLTFTVYVNVVVLLNGQKMFHRDQPVGVTGQG